MVAPQLSSIQEAAHKLGGVIVLDRGSLSSSWRKREAESLGRHLQSDAHNLLGSLLHWRADGNMASKSDASGTVDHVNDDGDYTNESY
jgi:hypothetical protein